MSSHSDLHGRGRENNSSEASPTRRGESPRLNPVGSDETSNSGNNFMSTLSSWEKGNMESDEGNHGSPQSHGPAETTGGEISTPGLFSTTTQGGGISARFPRTTPSFVEKGGQVQGRDGDDGLQETGGEEGADGDEERFEIDEYHWRGQQHAPHHQRQGGRPRFAGGSNEQGDHDGRGDVGGGGYRHSSGFMGCNGMDSYATQQDNDQPQQLLKTGVRAAREHAADANDNGENAPQGNDGNNFSHHKRFHANTAEQHRASPLSNGFDLVGGDSHDGGDASGRNVGEDSTTSPSMHYEHARRSRPSAGSFSESDADRGGDSRSLRDSRVAEAETRNPGSDMDDDDDCEEENGDGTEGQTQKRKRQERQEYYQRLVGDGFRTIAGCYVTTNRAIRGVEANQQHMLDVENEIGEDLVKFGAHIREATQLMQAQITAAFTGEEVTVPQRSNNYPDQVNQDAECIKSGPTKATTVRGRNNALTDPTAATTGGVSSKRGALRTNGSSPGLMSRPRTASEVAATPMPEETVGRSRHFDASGSTDGPQAYSIGNTHHIERYSVGGNDGHTVVSDEQQQQQQEEEAVAGRTCHSEEHAVLEGDYGGRVAPSLSEESRGGLKSGGNMGGGLPPVKRPRWNSSLSSGDGGGGVSGGGGGGGGGGAGGSLTSSLFRGQQQGASRAIAFQTHAEAHGRWSRE